MIKEALTKLADHFDSDKVGYFDMRSYENCVIGHGCRHVEGRTGLWNSQWAYDATWRVFGIHGGTPTADFLFDPRWSNDPKMAAVRLRYVALHGEAPSYDQWERFRYASPPWRIYEQKKPAEVEEVEEETAGCA